MLKTKNRKLINALLDYYQDVGDTPDEAMEEMRDDFNSVLFDRGCKGIILASDLEQAVVPLLEKSGVL